MSGWFWEPVLPAVCKTVEESEQLLFGSTPNPASMLLITKHSFSCESNGVTTCQGQSRRIRMGLSLLCSL